MDYKEYSEKATTTAIYPNSGKNIIYPILGLIGESGEIADKLRYMNSVEDKKVNTEVAKEIGDVYWYINAICFETGLDFADILNRPYLGDNNAKYSDLKIVIDCSTELMVISSQFAEKTKKLVRDRNGVVDDKYIEFVDLLLTSVAQCLFDICYRLRVDVKEVLKINIDKLFSRKERGKLKGDGDNR